MPKPDTSLCPPVLPPCAQACRHFAAATSHCALRGHGIAEPYTTTCVDWNGDGPVPRGTLISIVDALTERGISLN